MKVYELCPSINFSAVSETTVPGGSAKPGGKNLDNSEEEEEEEEDNEEEEEEAELEEISQPLEKTGVEMEQTGEGGGENISAAGTEEIPPEELLSKTEVPPTGEMQPASTSDSTASNLSAQAPVPTPGTPFPRKRISSKSLKVGMIPASKRVCLIEEPKGKYHFKAVLCLLARSP